MQVAGKKIPSSSLSCDDIPSPVIIHKKNSGTIIKFNKAANKLFGLSSNKSLTVKAIRVKDTLPKPVRAGDFLDFGPVMHRSKKGDNVPMRMLRKTVKFDGHECYADFFEETTNHLLIKENLIATSLDAIISVTTKGSVIDWNPAAE
jgi:hypothetical protein